jgi:hypothetical protein
VGWSMQDLLRKAEHYRELAVKYHELGKGAEPPFLGDFYRGVAVRYVFMAQEVSERAKKGTGVTTEPSGCLTSSVVPVTQDRLGETLNSSPCGPQMDCGRKNQNRHVNRHQKVGGH